jgi:hypothetical protein
MLDDPLDQNEIPYLIRSEVEPLMEMIGAEKNRDKQNGGGHS